MAIRVFHRSVRLKPSLVRIRAKTRWLGRTAAVAGLLCLTAAGRAQPAQSPTPEPAEPPPDVSAESAFDIDVQIGYCAYQTPVKQQLWTPVWVEVQAREGDLNGWISLAQDRNPMKSILPTRVPEGTTKRLLTYYNFEPHLMPKLELEYRFRGLRRDGFPHQFRIADARDQHILVLAEGPGGFQFLGRQGVELERTDQNNIYHGAVQVLYGEVERIPEDPIALEPLDAIVFNTQQVRRLTQAQWEAIQTWIEAGGRVLVAGGKLQPFIEQSVLGGAWGIDLAAPQPGSLTATLGPGAAPEGKADEFLASWPSGEWTEIVLGSQERPFLVSRAIGQGAFQVCAAALEPPILEAIHAARAPEELWPRLLERHWTQTPLDFAAREAEALIGHDLQRPYSFRLVGASWVFRYLGLYILLALPLNWFICGRLGRREWAWPVAVVVALGFAYYGYRSGLQSQSSDFAINQVTLMRKTADSNTARAAAFSSIYSPRRFRADLILTAPSYPRRMSTHTPGMRMGGYDQDLYASSDLDVIFGSAVALEGLFIYPWSARSLRTDFTVEFEGRIETREPLRLNLGQKAFESGGIVNRTPWTYKKWWIVYRHGLWEGVTELAPEESIDLRAIVREGNRRSLDAVRTTIAEMFIDPYKQQSENRNNTQWIYQQVDTQWRRLAHQPQVNDQFFFMGRVDEALSPLTSSVKADQVAGVVIYEQPLDAGPRGAAKPMWTAMLVDSTPNTQMPGFYHNPNFVGVDVGDSGVWFDLRETDVWIIPDRPIREGLERSATIKLKIDGGRSGAVRGQDNQYYKLVGCPVQIYNRRAESWEETEILDMGRHKIEPIADYLHPATSALLARMRAEPDELRCRVASSQEDLDSAPIKTGKDIWGPQSAGMPGRGMNQNWQMRNIVSHLQLSNLEVTLE